MLDTYEVFRLSNYKISVNTHNHIHLQTHSELKLLFIFNTISINLLFFSRIIAEIKKKSG